MMYLTVSERWIIKTSAQWIGATFTNNGMTVSVHKSTSMETAVSAQFYVHNNGELCARFYRETVEGIYASTKYRSVRGPSAVAEIMREFADYAYSEIEGE